MICTFGIMSDPENLPSICHLVELDMSQLIDSEFSSSIDYSIGNPATIIHLDASIVSASET